MGRTPYDEALQGAIPGLSPMGARILLSGCETDKARSYSRARPHYDAMPAEYASNYTRHRMVSGVENLDNLGAFAEHCVQPAGTHNRGWQSWFLVAAWARAVVLKVTGGARFHIPPRRLLVMKDADKKLQALKDTRETRILWREVEEINEALRGFETLGVEMGTAFRSFNNGSLHEGGRLYWPGLNQPKKERDMWILNGEPTIELDFVSIHPSLLYAERRLPIPPDCYDDIPGGFMRDHLKIALSVMVNAKGKASAAQAIAVAIENMWRKSQGRDKLRAGDDVPKGCISLAWRLMKAHEVRHKAIAWAFYTGYGTRLQNTDSLILLAVERSLRKQGVPVLCIHDSFRVQARYESLLNDTMRQCADEIARADLQVKRQKKQA